jgi:hypothetical protein
MFASPAFGLLESTDIEGSSTYNPVLGDEVYWRWGWGNTMQPDFTLTSFPSDNAAELQGMGFQSAHAENVQTTGFIYEMRQMGADGSGDPPTPTVGVSPLTGREIEGQFQGELKTLLVGDFDVAGMADQYGWLSDSNHPGGHVTGEGIWRVRFLFRNQFRTEVAASPGSVRRARMGVDLTAPDTVRNFRALYTPTHSASGWQETRRMNFGWDSPSGIDDNYDRLSGVGGFSITLDGSEVMFVTNTAPDPAFEPYGEFINKGAVTRDPQVTNFAHESLPAGMHTVGVTTVDRATNTSADSATFVTKVDYDTPSGEIVWTDGSRPTWRLGSSGTVSVRASDAAGVSGVVFYLDGLPIGSGVDVGSGIWSLSRGFTGFTNGSHVLTAVVSDRIGQDAPTSGSWQVPHTKTLTQVVTVDKTPPTARVSASSSKRVVALKIKSLSRPASMVVTIDGVAYPEVSAGAGRTYTRKHSVPRRASGNRTRRVRWSVKLTDSVGNVTTYSGRSTVTYWKLKRLSRSKVRVIVY